MDGPQGIYIVTVPSIGTVHLDCCNLNRIAMERSDSGALMVAATAHLLDFSDFRKMLEDN